MDFGVTKVHDHLLAVGLSLVIVLLVTGEVGRLFGLLSVSQLIGTGVAGLQSPKSILDAH
jgi:hypothetical protein